MRHAAIWALAALFAAAGGNAQAQDSYPSQLVKIVVPAAAGSTTDTLARLVADQLARKWGKPAVVENIAGGGMNIGAGQVARAAPDGHTLVVSGVASHAIAPSLPRGTPYDPIRDFTHIALFGGPPAVLVVNPSVPAKDLHEFVALLKKEPGKYSYGSPGNGTHGQLVAELFKQLAGVQMQHVPYKGASVAISDLMAGHIPVASTTLTTAAGQIHAGKARALAISSQARLPDYPNVPTYSEMGYKDLVATVWFSLSGPAGMPEAVVQRLNAEVRKALDAPDTRQRLRPEGIEPGTLSPREFTAFVEAELKRWAPVVKASGTKTD
jgi:tripartite-type tricarboxylate transporter receptor subunit TctC